MRHMQHFDIEYFDIETHWIALHSLNNNFTYNNFNNFNFGFEHIPKEIRKFLGNKNIITKFFRI